MESSEGWIDLSVPLRVGALSWPNSPTFERAFHRSPDKGDATLDTWVGFDLHTGTHVEAPLHLLPHGDPTSSGDPLKLCARVAVVDIAHDRAQSWVRSIDSGVQGVLFKTTNSELNLWGRESFQEEFAGISMEDARAATSLGHLQFTGADYLSIEAMATGGAVHRELLGNGIWILEGLDMRPLSPGTYEMLGLYLAIEASEAAPARVLVRRCSDDYHVEERA